MELMSAIIEPNNMLTAYRRVTRNKGAAGVDGMRVEQLKAYLKQHWPTLKQQLVDGTYQLPLKENPVSWLKMYFHF